MAVDRRLSLHPDARRRVGGRGGGALLIPPIERIAETGSTNADLLARLASGEFVGEGHWLVADRQTAGRGRLGRGWNDGQGNFMGSTVVHLTAGDPSPATLALVAGVALAKAVTAMAPGLGAQLKWPNDLLVDGAKCAGILMERVRDSIVIGIGVNLVAAPELPDRPTASLTGKKHYPPSVRPELVEGPSFLTTSKGKNDPSTSSGQTERGDGAVVPIDRDRFADALAIAMTDALWTWRQEGVGRIIAAWLPQAHPVGTPLRVSEQGVDGVFDGLAPDGALRLRREGGETMLVYAGDVELRRPVGEGK